MHIYVTSAFKCVRLQINNIGFEMPIGEYDLIIVAVQIVELINSSNKCSKFMRAAHSNLQRQNTVYSHKKYVILQHLLLMRLTVDTR